MSVRVVLPTALRDLTGGARHVDVDVDAGATVADVLDAVAASCPALARRLRDDSGALRRFVNVYVDGDDVRHVAGLATAVADGTVVEVIPSVAGG